MSIRREANFQTLFRHWLKAHHREFESCAFELKQTTSASIPFDAVAEHQAVALAAVRGRIARGLLYKAPDDSRGVKPFDFFFLRDAQSYVVIRFPSFFCVIDFGDFEMARKTADRKSLTAEYAMRIAQHVVPL